MLHYSYYTFGQYYLLILGFLRYKRGEVLGWGDQEYTSVILTLFGGLGMSFLFVVCLKVTKMKKVAVSSASGLS